MNAYLFDVDGVLNHPKTKSMAVEEDAIALLVSLMKKGEPVGLISGRSIHWQIANVVELIEKYVERSENVDKKIIDNLFVSGEFGVASIVHENTERKLVIDESLAVPASLFPALEEASAEFLQDTFRETEKDHTFTLVAKHTVNREDFKKVQNAIETKFLDIITGYPELEIHKDRTAVNVKNRNANKRSAAEHFLTWLKEKNFAIDAFYVFGDSLSDLEMGDALAKKGLPFTFVFVGDKEDLHDKTFPFEITFPEEKNADGTLSFFKENFTAS